VLAFYIGALCADVLQNRQKLTFETRLKDRINDIMNFISLAERIPE